MPDAPYFDDIAAGPEGGFAAWLTTADGLRIRVGHWPLAEAKGTILIFPGRTEFVEKYGQAAKAFAERGYASIAVDWRGQGLADRMLPDRRIGHVGRFADYQQDVQAVLAHVKVAGLPAPYFLIGHSMGGAIGLRALHRGLPVSAAMFSAPMWGLNLSGVLRASAWGVSTLGVLVGLDGRIAPGQTPENYTRRTTFAENTLTGDADMFAFLQNQLNTHPDLALGGPSLRWLNAALHETRALRGLACPTTPALTFLGSDEVIVDPEAITRMMAAWPQGRLETIAGGKHEMMMDAPAMRTRIFDDTAAFFDRHRGTA